MLALSTAVHAQQDGDKVSASVGTLTLLHDKELIANKIKVQRGDTITFVDSRYPDIEGFLFFVSPAMVKGKTLSPIFLEKLRNDVGLAWTKNNQSTFKWKRGEKLIPISKHQLSAQSFLGWNGKTFISLDLRTISFKDNVFTVGILVEQGQDEDGKSSFEDGFIFMRQVHLELLAAKLTSNVTGEPEPVGWPPDGLQGAPATDKTFPPKQGPPPQKIKN